MPTIGLGVPSGESVRRFFFRLNIVNFVRRREPFFEFNGLRSHVCGRGLRSLVCVRSVSRITIFLFCSILRAGCFCGDDPFIAAPAAAMIGVQAAHLPLPAADGSEVGAPLGSRSATTTASSSAALSTADATADAAAHTNAMSDRARSRSPPPHSPPPPPAWVPKAAQTATAAGRCDSNGSDSYGSKGKVGKSDGKGRS